MIRMIKCNKCGQLKHLSELYRSGNCKDCVKAGKSAGGSVKNGKKGFGSHRELAPEAGRKGGLATGRRQRELSA